MYASLTRPIETHSLTSVSRSTFRCVSTWRTRVGEHMCSKVIHHSAGAFCNRELTSIQNFTGPSGTTR